MREPFAIANLTPIPDVLTDERVLMCLDIMRSVFGGAEAGQTKIGDAVAIFAQGPIAPYATAGARLKGASQIILVDSLPERLEAAMQLGADFMLDYKRVDPVVEILKITDGRGVDVSIEPLGTQQTFESCLRSLKPGGTMSSLGAIWASWHCRWKHLLQGWATTSWW